MNEHDSNKETSISPVKSGSLAGELTPGPGLTPPDFIGDPRGNLYFSRYKEDGTLRLFKKGSLLSSEPAGYADFEVTVKVLVETTNERFMVVLPTTRMELSHPKAQERLAEMAWSWRR